ncbi:phage tail terminator protein [Roseospira visakhapatnamensis]|uniref:Uncharacterized protein n=1 Tax=Roseospira visakhapatnamensis TaxID=390880 RepID=A0A7W6WBL4_9PROT|nr:hypothetical protein [Roseospira visakhapatnamensis]MBB4268144.1 hypothetical protein [Roseospira visakhapatnamensis]
MIGAALVDPLIARVAAVPGIATVETAEDLAALIAAGDLPKQTPAAFMLPSDEGAETLARSVHTSRISTIMTAVLATRASGRGPADRPLDALGHAVIRALDGVAPADGWTPLGYQGGRQQIRAASRDRQGAVFLTLDFLTTTTLRRT